MYHIALYSTPGYVARLSWLHLLQCAPRGRRIGAKKIADGRNLRDEAVERRISPARYLCDGR